MEINKYAYANSDHNLHLYCAFHWKILSCFTVMNYREHRHGYACAYVCRSGGVCRYLFNNCGAITRLPPLSFNRMQESEWEALQLQTKHLFCLDAA